MVHLKNVFVTALKSQCDTPHLPTNYVWQITTWNKWWDQKNKHERQVAQVGKSENITYTFYSEA